MLSATIKTLVLDKSISGNISLQVLATISNDTGNPVKFRITDEYGNVLEKVDTYVAPPVDVSKFFYLDTKVFKRSTFLVKIVGEDNKGNKFEASKTTDTFQIGNLIRTSDEGFQWSVKNFSNNSIYTMLQVFDPKTNNVLLNSSEYRKIYSFGSSYYKYDFDELQKLPEGKYNYRVRYYNKDEGWTRFYPNENGIELEVRKNTVPVLRIKDAKVRKESSYFALSGKVLFADNEEDDITYTITDNLGNLIQERTNYIYSPKLEYLNFEYPLVHFNSTHLVVKVDVNDRLLGQNHSEYKIRLFKIYDFFRERHMFRWKFRNYSNKSIAMQVEITDFYGNILKKGEVIRRRDSFDYMQIQDPSKLMTERDYYKYRLKVWCEEEGWSEYYPNENGIQFTNRVHTPPKIEIKECSVIRDLDDIKYLNLKAKITDVEQDQILYTVTDSSNTVIRKLRDYVDTPHEIDIQPVYDIINKSHVDITLSVIDDNGSEARKTVTATAYTIHNLRQEKGHIFKWKIDNFSKQTLKLMIEVLKYDEQTKKNEVIRNSTTYTVGTTIRPKSIVDRLYPKLPVGDYFYRLKVISEGEEWSTYFPDENGLPFTAEQNHPPIIDLDSIEVNKVNDSSFTIGVGGTVTDEDDDLIKYTIKDQLGNVLSDTGKFIETPANINGSHVYNIDRLETSRVVVYIDCLDEGDAVNTLTEIINLFEVQNLYRDYDKFYWLFKNFSKYPLTCRLEILDAQGNLAGAGKYNNISTNLDYREYRDIIDLSDYDDGNYFFRLKVNSDRETWNYFYPNINGIPFTIKKNHAPDIDITTKNINKVAGKDIYNLSVKGKITDKDGDKVYYVIKDDLKG